MDDLNEEVSDLEHLLKEGEVTKDKIILTTNESRDWAFLSIKILN